MKFINKHT